MADRRTPSTPIVPGGRRDHLDGIRTIAVYLVIAFHSGIARWGGGHIGVDVFFVLSGYLVTGVLLRDIAEPGDADGGRIRFGRFYSRRARRLLPAALLCLLGTAVAYAAFADAGALRDATDGFRAAAVYLTNWYLIDASTGYFEADTTQSPILHFWSLAVEEQFYLLWPLLFAGIVAMSRAAGRHRWQVVRGVVAVIAAASALWLFVIRYRRPVHAYYGTDVRAYQLLAGALLALCPAVIVWAKRWGRLNELAVIAAVLGLVAVSVMPSRLPVFARGYAATILTIVILVALESGAARRAAAVIGAAPLAYLGAISYGTSLWHWPVIVIAGTMAELQPVQLGILSAVIGTALAALSYQLVEQPIRSARPAMRWSWPIAVGGLALSILIGLVALPWITRPQERGGGSTAAAAELSGYTPVPASYDFQAVKDARFGASPSCSRGEPESCIRVRGDGPHITIFGDSNAAMWTPAFTAMAEEHGYTFSVLGRSGCRWQDGLYATSRSEAADRAVCDEEHRFAYDDAIDALDPDLLVLVNSVELEPAAGTKPGSSLADDIEQTTTASLEELDRRGVRTLVIESKPMPQNGSFDPAECLAEATVLEECRFATLTEPTWIEEFQRELASDLANVSTTDLDRLVCPLAPICDPFVDGIPVYWDGRHITVAFAEHLTPKLHAHLQDSGLLSGG